MISTEQAFDMLPFMVDIIDKLNVQKEGKKIADKIKETNPDGTPAELQNEAGIEIIKYVVKNSQKVKEEFFNVVAIAAAVDIKTAKARPLTESIQTFKDIFMDKDLMDFFKTAMQ